jgi:hypothetical protein
MSGGGAGVGGCAAAAIATAQITSAEVRKLDTLPRMRAFMRRMLQYTS